MNKKYKILGFMDHPLSTSGVGIQAGYLINGLLETGKYSFRIFGAAVKHADYSTIAVNEDYIIKPIDGFGDRELLRTALATEKPDAIFIFTDPRFFIWMWELEDEIHQVCPIVYWTVWDNRPTPFFNKVLYQSTDLLNCHSHLTYEMIGEILPERLHDGTLNFIPHALPDQIFHPIDDSKVAQAKKLLLGDKRQNDFLALWINRNAKRKRANDVIEGWSIFLQMLHKKYGHKNAALLMHTDPFDSQGSNLVKTAELYNIKNNIFFSKDRIGFEQIAMMHNVSDVFINVSCNEGFGLGTLEAMQCGKPIIALKTGGLTRQVVDHRDGTENGIALDVEMKTLVGSQLVPYIYEDYCSNESLASAIMKIYELGPEGRKKLGKKAREYVLSEFSMQKTVNEWDKTLFNVIQTWKNDRQKIYKSWQSLTI